MYLRATTHYSISSLALHYTCDAKLSAAIAQRPTRKETISPRSTDDSSFFLTLPLLRRYSQALPFIADFAIGIHSKFSLLQLSLLITYHQRYCYRHCYYYCYIIIVVFIMIIVGIIITTIVVLYPLFVHLIGTVMIIVTW